MRKKLNFFLKSGNILLFIKIIMGIIIIILYIFIILSLIIN